MQTRKLSPMPVEECPGWPRRQMRSTKLERVGREMLKAIAIHLGLDEQYFEQFVLETAF